MKKSIAILLVLALSVAILSGTKFTADYIYTSVKVTSEQTILIDAGHGGFDGGAVASDGTVEKDINLKIAMTLSQMLKSAGFRVISTREADVSTDDVETNAIAIRKKSDLKNRLKLMSDYPDAVFVSIHLNKFTTSAARGSQVFYNGKIAESKVLGAAIQDSIIKLLQPDNTRVNKQATSSTYLLYNATIPAVLVECGFLSNKAELELLKDTEYQKKIAFCCFLGIMEYFSNKGDLTNVAKV
ncbi:MAG: N-acetylmuramoyl-L-alanine amidase [Clostridia bacterium]|nr:N-acetylmuramoyl-L-alanine amidase [Clostridia bacterium]